MDPGSAAGGGGLSAEQAVAALHTYAAGSGPSAAAAPGAAGTATPAAAAAAAAAAAPQGDVLYYVTFRDQKDPASRNTSKKPHGHSYTIKFYLVDNEGMDHLAAGGCWGVAWGRVGVTGGGGGGGRGGPPGARCAPSGGESVGKGCRSSSHEAR